MTPAGSEFCVIFPVSPIVYKHDSFVCSVFCRCMVYFEIKFTSNDAVTSELVLSWLCVLQPQGNYSSHIYMANVTSLVR